MSIIGIIKRRRSCRTFNQILLNPSDKKVLENFIIENVDFIGGEKIDLCIIEKKDVKNRMEINYGLIKGHNTYLLGTAQSSPDSRVHYGYLVEKVVLKATEIGIATCWIGYFDDSYFNEISIAKGYEIPSIVILGYPRQKLTSLDKLARFASNASERLKWERLFFNYNSKFPLEPDFIKEYSDSLEMVRLAPSSGNTQPWRIFFNDSTREFHFYKNPISRRYEDKGLHDIDMGIALSHFELTSLYNNLSGTWIRYNQYQLDSIYDWQYILTWKCS